MAFLTLEGVEQFLKNLDTAGERLTAAGAAALYQIGNNVISKSNELCPVDTGTLRRSGYCTLPELVGDMPLLEVGYGGMASTYAESVHEETAAYHKVGEAKFLEKALDEARSTWSEDISELTKRNFERGATWPSQGKAPVDPNLGEKIYLERQAKRISRAKARKAAKGTGKKK